MLLTRGLTYSLSTAVRTSRAHSLSVHERRPLDSQETRTPLVLHCGPRTDILPSPVCYLCQIPATRRLSSIEVSYALHRSSHPRCRLLGRQRNGSRVASRADSLRRALATLGIPRDSLVNRSRWYWWRGRIEVIAGPVKFAPRSTPGADPRFNYPDCD